MKKIPNDNPILLKDPNNTFWITDFKASLMWIFIINDKYYVLTDGRYYSSMKQKIGDKFSILPLSKETLEKEIYPKIKEKGILCVDGNDWSVRAFLEFEKKMKSLGIELQQKSFEKIRSKKSSNEVKRIRQACKITDEIFDIIDKSISPGQTENDVLKLIKEEIIKRGLRPSFDPIVAAGVNGSFPHHSPTDYVLKPNDMVTIDFGVFYDGYVSDMTRTISMSKDKLSNEQQEIHKIVSEAMSLAIKGVKDGVKVNDIDKIARDYIKEKGYGEYFTHSLGHGIGVEIHEYPNVGSLNSDTLQENSVITIEPGIYIPNKFGVRIEQDILVKKDGCEILNKSRINL